MNSSALDAALARWVFALMGGLWVLVGALALVTGHRGAGVGCLAVSCAYAGWLAVRERVKARR